MLDEDRIEFRPLDRIDHDFRADRKFCYRNEHSFAMELHCAERPISATF